MGAPSAGGPLCGRIALVTGAGSGIGQAIALALSHQQVQVLAAGRDPRKLAETVDASWPSSPITPFPVDLTVDGDLTRLVRYLEDKARGLDILIHSAGIIHQDPMERARVENLDRQYATNLRAPYLLSQHLLPMLTVARGQIVFINSSAGLSAKWPDLGQYSATKHALRAVADSLREEVNPRGIRVLTVYLGRTATPMQRAVFEEEGRVYRPELLLQPEDVATMVVQALMLPPTAEVTDMSIRPMIKQ